MTQELELSAAINFDGHVNNFVPPNKIIGWAVNLNKPEKKIEILVKLSGEIIGRAIADQHRQDLERFGSGNYVFEVNCTSELPYNAILAGEVSIELYLDKTSIGNLYFDQTTENIVTTLQISRLLSDLDAYDASTLHNTLNHALRYTAEPVASVLRAAITILKNRQEILSTSNFVPGSISSVYLKTGIISSDRAAMLGQDGHLFLIEGSNNVTDIFERSYTDDGVLHTALSWAALIRYRHELATANGSAFIQIIIPEKISIARELLDQQMSSPSAALAVLEQKLSSEITSKIYISGLSVLNELPYATGFRKIDTHLSPQGAFAIFCEICRRLNYNIVDNIPFDVPLTVTGDLAKRFFGHEFYEVCQTAKEPHFKVGLRLMDSFIPPNGGYIGKRYVFKNDLAPIRKKAVLFGNSFFDNHVFQGSVSYWMSIWFEEYHFIFSPEMNTEYIEVEKPDIVICQTIERFLEVVPQH